MLQVQLQRVVENLSRSWDPTRLQSFYFKASQCGIGLTMGLQVPSLQLSLDPETCHRLETDYPCFRGGTARISRGSCVAEPSEIRSRFLQVFDEHEVINSIPSHIEAEVVRSSY